MRSDMSKHEDMLRADSMAENLLNNSVNDFWKDVKVVHRNSLSLPCSMEGVYGAENIVELWRQHYSALCNE